MKSGKLNVNTTWNKDSKTEIYARDNGFSTSSDRKDLSKKIKKIVFA